MQFFRLGMKFVQNLPIVVEFLNEDNNDPGLLKRIIKRNEIFPLKLAVYSDFLNFPNWKKIDKFVRILRLCSLCSLISLFKSRPFRHDNATAREFLAIMSPQPPYLQTWPRATFFYTQNWSQPSFLLAWSSSDAHLWRSQKLSARVVHK